MTVTFNTSALLSWYQAKADVPAGGSSSTTSSASTSKTKAPTPPWSTTPTAAQTNAKVQAALSGQSIINPSASKTTTSSSGASTTSTNPNYNSLFTLYQGLSTLSDLATQAAVPNQSSFQLSQLQTAFSGGLAEVQNYLTSSPFTGFDVTSGTDTAQQQSTAAVPTASDVYTTGTIYSGDQNTPIPALAGNISFSATVTTQYNAPKTINFNLDDMGSTPRTIGNVVNYLNAQLKAAGVATSFSVVNTPGAPQTVSIGGGKTVTLPAGPDQFSLKLNGNSIETVSFSAPTQTPAVYVTQTAGLAPTTTTSTTSSSKTSTSSTSSTSSNSTSPPGTTDATQQLIKFDPSSSTPTVFTDALGNEVTNVTATAAGADGSVYVLGDINGPTTAGEISSSQKIPGAQDVALLKYDSAGNLISTSVLGAASSASGLSLAVSADGSQVAVAGTVTGALAGTTTPANSTEPSSFVSVFDSSGDPVWTARQNAAAGDQVNSVAFGADGSVYVGGTTQSSLTNAPITGQTAAYLTGYSSTGAQTFTTQLGTAGFNTINGVAVDGSTIVTAGVQNGDAVVNSFTIPSSGTPTLTATQNLGALDGGSVAGVSVNADGSVVVAGSTHNGALNAGTVTTPYASGEEAFVAQLSSSLTPSASDTLTYYKGAGDTSASAVTTSGGQVYITGQVTATPTGGEITAYDGYVAQIDPTTGAVAWSNTINSANNESAPTGIAVDPTGSSVLDLLGLPSGTIDNTPNPSVVANSSVAAGDKFTVTAFGAAQTITVTASDTLKTLAAKIQQASGYQATATVVTTSTGQEIQIKPNNPSAKVTIGDGPAGEDALPGLGLTAGVITDTTTIASKTSTVKTSYGLNLPTTLNLNSSTNIAQANAALKAATGTVASIYLNLTTPPASKTGTTNSSNGAVPAYLKAEISNYQAGLSRLTGSSSTGSSTSSSSSGSILSLFGG
jgi:hypothetical protein